MKVLLVLFILAFSTCFTNGAGRKRNKQEIKFRGNHLDASQSQEDTPSDFREVPVSIQSGDPLDVDHDIKLSCPVKKDKLRFAIVSFWRNSLVPSFVCANEANIAKSDGVAQSLLHYLTNSRYALSLGSDTFSLPAYDAPNLLNWEILGPFPVGKLEVDGDPSFDFVYPDEPELHHDPVLKILTIPYNAVLFSELVSGSKVSWQTVVGKGSNAVVEVRFSTLWNELGQALSDAAVFEFQGWARTTTYVRSSGQHSLHCQGVHTVYIRNDNATRVVVGDVYHSGKVFAALDLRVGPVGIVIPLRGVAQTSFSCRLQAVSSPLVMLGVTQLPDLITLPYHIQSDPHIGLLLSSVFNLGLFNSGGQPLSVELAVEQQLKAGQKRLMVRRPHPDNESNSSSVMEYSIVIAPGQLLNLPLEIYSEEDPIVYLSCRKGASPITLVITPSRGQQARVSLEFACRKHTQSFQFSYLDHDHSVSQAGVIFPLLDKPENSADPSVLTYFNKYGWATPLAVEEHLKACETSLTCEVPASSSFPALLTLHGTGLTGSNQADAYKMMPPGSQDYVFGVEGLWLVAPSRHGAHNWEAVGELSALSALDNLRSVVSKFKFLPQVSSLPGIIGGHSMGGHGAWVVAVNNPERAVCVAPAASWIRKEEYAAANAFFDLDIQNSFVDPDLKSILEKGMSEFHVDRFVKNLVLHDIQIRVGSQDMTTHAWFSRRMHRLLQRIGVNSSLEEVPNKQHWWWDTKIDNDGGVLNDPHSRAFYEYCLFKIHLIANTTWVRTSSTNVNSNKIIRSESKVPKNSKSMSTSSKLPPRIRCEDNFALSAINLGSNKGLCGLQFWQQFRHMSQSTASVRCKLYSQDEVIELDDSLRKGRFDGKKKVCTIVTSNVRLLRISRNSTILSETNFIIVDNVVLHIEDASFLDDFTFVRWNDSHPAWNKDVVDSLRERVPSTSGPVRGVYSRPFHIVYGTPLDHSVRNSIRDLAVYIGNSHFSAHSTHVRVMSDLEYRSGKYMQESTFSNIILIGGPETNKVSAKLLRNEMIVSNSVQIQALSPIHFGSSRDTYLVGSHTVAGSDLGLIFTFPLVRRDNKREDVAMGVCIDAFSALGYIHLSRLAWPVIPPMVRSPFANYIPDFVIVDGGVWRDGFGGVRLAGFWNSTWNFDSKQSYWN